MLRWALAALLLLAALLCCLPAAAQLANHDPGQEMALIAGEGAISLQNSKTIAKQTDQSVQEGVMVAEFNKIKKWEQQYVSYLSAVCSALNAGTHIFTDGLRIVVTLGKLGKALKNNPQGIVAPASINNMYMETAVQFATVFTLLKNTVAKGGPGNMLNGQERLQMLWELEDALSDFSRKLNTTYMTVRMYDISDILYNKAGYILAPSRHSRATLAATRSYKNWRDNARDAWTYR